MMGIFLSLWMQWFVGPIGMIQTFQAVGAGQKFSQQRLSWGMGTAIGKVFGKEHWGITVEVLTALVQISSRIETAREVHEMRTRLTAAEGVFLGEHYWQLSESWGLMFQLGGILNLPYRMEYFAQRTSPDGTAFLFMAERRYWEIQPNRVQVGTLPRSPYPEAEISVLGGIGLEKHLTPHWSLAMDVRFEYSPQPIALPVQEGAFAELAGWHLPTRPPHLIAETFQLGLYYFFHPLKHCN